MGTIEGVSRIIKPYLCTFLCDQVLHYRHGLVYDSLSIFVCVFASMGESLLVDQV